jgi:hypothetical protein
MILRLLATRLARVAAFAFVSMLLVLPNVHAYVPDDTWTVTASDNIAASGTPAVLTWSFADDGTSIPSEGASNLVSYFDDLFNVATSSTDLTQRPWFSLFEDSFDRWSELGGIEFVYEPNDDGATLQSSRGVLGVRGDIRLGGAYVDGSSGTLAYTWLPNSGDMVVDTGETSFYSNSSDSYRQLRNTIMHELGHAFGLLHLESSNAELLMEPYINTSFDGPQLDDIRGLHGLYGDINEKSNNRLGNGTAARATSLGSLVADGDISIGSDAAGNQVVLSTETDFVSITNASDVDFYSFTIDTPGLLDVTLTPWGGTFNQGVEGGAQSSFNATARNDLSLAVFDTNGITLLESVNDTGVGFAESFSAIELSAVGQYYLRVTGASSSVQLYELDLSFTQAVSTLDGDFDTDGDVDGRDFLAWQRGYGNYTASDLAAWQAQFGASSPGASVAAVPEPNPLGLVLLMAAVAIIRRS